MCSFIRQSHRASARRRKRARRSRTPGWNSYATNLVPATFSFRQSRSVKGKRMQGKQRDRFEVAPALTILAAGALSATLQWTNGAYHPTWIVVVSASWLVVLVVILGRPRMTIPWPETQGLLGALGLVVA